MLKETETKALANIRVLASFFLFTFIVSCSSVTKIDRVETSQYRFSKSEFALVDSSIYYLTDPYRKSLEATMNEVLAISDQPMEKGYPEGLLGNFVADLCLYQSNKIMAKQGKKAIDICYVNNGGLRSALPKGEITRGKAYELMPFENELVVLELTATNTRELAEYISYKGGAPVSNMTIVISDRKAKEVKVAGKEIDDNETYLVVTSDYLANKGDLRFFNEPLATIPVGKKVRDAIIDHMTELNSSQKSIQVKLDGRVRIEDE